MGSRGRRYPVRSRSAPDPSLVTAQREARHRQALRSLIGGALPPGGLTHEWLADQSGIPVGYLRWRYPTIGDLVRTLDTAPA